LPIAHIEAGARSYDMTMPEEINRRLTDHCSTLLFTPTENCTKNLLQEGINSTKIHQTGDTMYDVLLQQLPKAEITKILTELNLEPKTYALLTTHRPENVDNPKNLKNIIDHDFPRASKNTKTTPNA
jgi:UDP-N-acetylglucosamine 2-epimerase